MKIKGKFTKLLDGKKGYDVSLFSNSRDQQRVIITCDTENDAIEFISGFDKLLEKYTREYLEDIDAEISD